MTKKIYDETDFLRVYKIDENVCDELIEYFKQSKNVKQGLIHNHYGESVVNKKYKDSLDLNISPYDLSTPLKRYMIELSKCSKLYIQDYPYSNEASPWAIVDNFNIQYYPPGGGFKNWHSERGGVTGTPVTRHLVWMTYLNDVFDEDDEAAGGTDFLHQKIVTPARKGHTVIWPADWTFTHRGRVSNNCEKYIITGWFNFITEDKLKELSDHHSYS